MSKEILDDLYYGVKCPSCGWIGSSEDAEEWELCKRIHHLEKKIKLKDIDSDLTDDALNGRR